MTGEAGLGGYMANIENRCPICEEGELTAHNDFEEQDYRGQTGNIPFVYSECAACGSEQASTAQARANKRAMLAFSKSERVNSGVI